MKGYKNGESLFTNFRNVVKEYDNGLSTSQIAKKTMLSYSTVYQFIKQIEKDRKEESELYASWTMPLKLFNYKRVLKEYDNGLNTSQIAKKTMLNYSTVSRIIKKIEKERKQQTDIK